MIDSHALRPIVRLRVGHQSTVHSLAFSPDGSLLLSSGWDVAVKVWDVATGELLRTIELGQEYDISDGLSCVRFLPDGRAAVGKLWGPLLVLDPQTGGVLHELPDAESLLCTWPDFRVAVTLGGDVRQVETRNWSQLWERDLGEEVCAAHASPDGRRLLVVGREHVFVLSADTGSVLSAAPLSAWPEASAFAPGGALLAIAPALSRRGRGQLISLIAPDSGTEVRCLGSPSTERFRLEDVDCLTFSPSGRRLACGFRDGNGYVWDVSSGEMLYRFSPPRGPRWIAWIRDIAFHPNGRIFAAAGDDRSISLRDAASGKLLRTFGRPSPPIRSIGLSLDGRRVACGDTGGGVRVWDLQSCRLLADLPSHGKAVSCVAFSADGEAVASCGWDGVVRMSHASSGTELWRIRIDGALIALAASPDGEWVTAGGWLRHTRRRLLLLLDAQTGELRRQIDTESQVASHITFSPDSRILAGNIGGEIHLWNVPTGRIVCRLRLDEWLEEAVFSPDGRFLAAGMLGPRVVVLDAVHGELLRQWEVQADGPGPLAFTSDGTTLAVATGYDNPIGLWDVATGRGLGELRGHRAPVRSLAITPNGLILISGSADGTVRLWDLPARRHLATLQTLPTHRGGRAEWIAFTPAGQFACSPGARRLIQWQVGQELLPAGTFWRDHYRPDGLRVIS